MITIDLIHFFGQEVFVANMQANIIHTTYNKLNTIMNFVLGRYGWL